MPEHVSQCLSCGGRFGNHYLNCPGSPMPDPPWFTTLRRVAAWRPPADITLAVTLTPADGRVTAVLIHEGGGVASEAFDGGVDFGDGYGRLDAPAGRLAGVAGVLALVEMCEGVGT